MEIRPCTAADLALLTAHWKVHGGAVHESHFAAHTAGSTAYLVAWQDQEPLGAGVIQWGGCVGERAQQAFPQAIEINHLQVRDGFRGRGVGTALITAAERLIAEAGKTQAAVAVADDNPGAQRLYATLGYGVTGIIDASEYSWVADDGTVRQASERNETLIKNLR